MSEHQERDWMGTRVCSRCYWMPEPGAMKPEPWPGPTAQLAAAQALISDLERERDEWHTEALRAIAS